MAKKRQKHIAKQLEAKPKSNLLKYGLIIGLLMAVTYVVFIPALDNDWTNWDDPKYILENHLIKDLSWERTRAIIKDDERKSGLYAPLTYLTWAWEHKNYLEDATYYHRDNVILHVMNTGLVFLLILLLVGRYEAAIIVSLLFGIHPLHVESVAWITERKDVLYTFFYLIGLNLYILYCSRERGKPILYFGTLVAFALSLFSKPAAVTFPLILILIDYFRGRFLPSEDQVEEKGNEKDKVVSWVFLDKIPFFVGSVAWGLKTIGAVRSIAEEGTFDYGERFMFGFYGAVQYLYKAVVPINLSCFYPFPTLESDGSLPWIFYLSPLIGGAIIFLVLLTVRKTKTVLFGALFFAFTIGLTLQFFPVGPNIMTDRYSYVPYIGIFFVIAMGYVWLIDQKETKYTMLIMLGTAGLAGFAGWCMYLSHERCDVWTNSETLWTDVIAKFPNASEGYLNRGQYYTDTDQFEKAMVDYDATLRLNPKSTLAYINRGNVYGRTEVYDKALENYSKAIELSPNTSKIYLNRGNVFGLQGDIPASIEDFTTAINLERNYLDAYINRGISYSKLNQFEKALLDFNAALALDPTSFKTISMRAYALLDMGRYDEAIADYNYLLQVNASDGNSYFYRGLAKYRKSNHIGAIKDYSLALQINPANGGAYLNRALAYEAIQDYSRALQDALAAQQAGQNIAPDFIQRLQVASRN